MIESGGVHRTRRHALGVFCAASIGLHALALAVAPQAGTGAANDDGTPRVLHAVLNPVRTALDPLVDDAPAYPMVRVEPSPVTSPVGRPGLPDSGEAMP